MLPLPAPFFHTIAAFLAASKTGQIVLEVKEGQVVKLGLTEWQRADTATACAPAVHGVE